MNRRIFDLGPTAPQKATHNPRSCWRAFDRDLERNGPITDQIKNVENEIALPIATIDHISSPRDVIRLANRVKYSIKTKFKRYNSIIQERLSILHFIYAFKKAQISGKRNIELAEKWARKTMSKILLKHYIREEKEILKLIKWEPTTEPSEN